MKNTSLKTRSIRSCLVGKVTIEQRLRDVQPLRQLARVAGEADFGEETHGLGQDLLLAIGRSEAFAALAVRHVLPCGSRVAPAFACAAAVAAARSHMV